MHFLVTLAVLVYAPPGGGASDRVDEARAALVAAARARGAVVGDGDAVAAAARAHADGWTAEADLGFFVTAGAAVVEGRRALGRVELEKSEAALAQAETLYAPELWRAGVAAEAAEAAKWHGVALFELGRRGEATRAWRRAVALEPGEQLTEAMVRPDVARAFGEALKRRATARLELGGDGILFVDGRRVGAAPLELPVGEHLVAARAPEAIATARLVELPAAGAAVTLRLEPDRRAQALASVRERPGSDGVEAVRAALGADAVIVAAVAVDAGVLTYAATRRLQGCGTETVTATRADELLRRLDAAGCVHDAPIAVLEAAAIAHPRPAPKGAGRLAGGGGLRGAAGGERDHGARLWQKPWLWLGVVGVVGVGVVVGVLAWPRDASYAATLDFHQFSLGAGYSSTR